MRKIGFQTIFFVGTLLTIELLFRFFSVNKLFPSPFFIASDLIGNFNYIVCTEAVNTIRTVIEGLVPAIFTGYILSFICFHYKRLNLLIRPIIDFTQLVPKTALIPVFVSISFLGYGQTTKLLIVFLISFFPVFIEVFNGLDLVNNKYLKLFKANFASKQSLILQLEIPSTLPFLINGVKISILYSVLGAVTSEIIIGGSGLGYLIEVSSSKLNFTRAFSGIVISVIIGVLLLNLFGIMSKTLLKKYTYGD